MIKKIIIRAIKSFVIIKYWYGNQTEDYYHWIDLLGLSEPTNRNWAGEDKVLLDSLNTSYSILNK